MRFKIWETTYQITPGYYCWTLSRVAMGRKTGREYLADETYHTTTETLADKLARMGMTDRPLDDHLEVLRDISSTLKALLPAFKTDEAA